MTNNAGRKMSLNQKELEQRLAAFCAPTLLGAKVGSLVCLSQQEFPALSVQVQWYDAELSRHGLRFEILQEKGSRSLIFVYWPERLQARLTRPAIMQILRLLGYPVGGTLSQMLQELRTRLMQQHFPHEIGLFLDYPVADVVGFVRKGGADWKLCGYWKVYDDVEKARELFARYDACKAHLCRFLAAGHSISQLYQAA